ncbi:hypothetical protein J2Z22_003127 [Paenibacillus forsythiae]|uniref:Uncharacterized protein n=1 Tax=Paenibacillus forsythiae TaxID=365616 RepID=A0ABU3H9S6_9BACL|nr:hypothetical protein [Paenibacillus forsythiae]MDT3427564.1 hypothetical protein [Paenibacillus forsythiae]
MKNRISYLVDYGEYGSESGFAGAEQAPDNVKDQAAESNGEGGIREEAASCTGAGDHDQYASQMPAVPLFWSFPRGRGVRQPWRTRLWEHQRDQL